MWYRGIGALGLVLLVQSAHAQQQDTTRRGWGIVYSSPRSRATATNVNASNGSLAPAASPTASPSTSTITPTPTPSTERPTTVLPTIRGSRYTGDAVATPAPTVTPPPPNGVYQGDRPVASAPAVAAPGTYDTLPPTQPTAANASVHLDELMSLHEYTATGLTNLKPQEVQALEIWLEHYRTALIDTATRAAQQRVSTSQVAPVAPTAPNATVAANTRSIVPANAHSVTGIRSGSRFVQIDDGSVWDIYPADQTETAGWQVGDYVTVRVANQAYGDFDHELVNSQRTGPVRAKFMGYARGQ